MVCFLIKERERLVRVLAEHFTKQFPELLSGKKDGRTHGVIVD